MSCRFELLDESVTGRVEICRACGCVAIHVGPMSLRIDRTGFTDLAGTIRRAQLSLERGDEGALAAGAGYGEITRGLA